MSKGFSRLHLQNISNFFITGDSTAMRIFLAMWNRLETAGFRCKDVENEDSNPWVPDPKDDPGLSWKPLIHRTVRDIPTKRRGEFETQTMFLDCQTVSGDASLLGH